MKIGIGGGIGPLRGGVSNRGIGGGVGPFSAGSSWKGGDSSLGCAALVMFFLVALVAVWPWFLGAWIATKFGAESPSTARTVTAWCFEGVWLAFLLLVIGVAIEQTVHERRARSRETSPASSPARRAPSSPRVPLQERTPPPTEFPDVAAAMEEGKRVLAIKLYRDATGLELRQARDAVDQSIR